MELPNKEFLCCKSVFQEEGEEEHLKATLLAVTLPNMCFLFENNNTLQVSQSDCGPHTRSHMTLIPACMQMQVRSCCILDAKMLPCPIFLIQSYAAAAFFLPFFMFSHPGTGDCDYQHPNNYIIL